MAVRQHGRETGPDTFLERLRQAPMVDTALAVMYAPLAPLTQRIHLHRRRSRRHRPQDVLLPRGFTAEVVATGFNAPVHCCFDDQGNCYVIECGHKIEAKPRILRVDTDTGESETFFELPQERWIMTGAVTGACWHEGNLYLMNTDTLSRITPDGRLEDVVTGLPGRGDHQSNYPVAGPDGKLYFGQGTYTNTGVVGADNYAYEWLPRFPEGHDVPGADIVLAGHNYEMPDVLGNPMRKVKTGAFVPFGTETQPGQLIPGNVKCNGSVLRCNPDGTDLELVAWGLRNPYGIAFSPDGRLFATEHGIDERNNRHIIGDLEDFYEIFDGGWYGWPDFASGIRLDDPRWGTGGRGREPVLAEHPDPDPPKPFANFPQHSGPNGVDFCRDPAFGFEGGAFVALFGDLTPVTARLKAPSGFKVVRVNMATQEVFDFAVNRIDGPASRLPHAGMERPSHCQFGPDGALYVVDFGEISIAPEKGGVRVWEGTGTLWRISRSEDPPGDKPPAPKRVPSYAIKAALAGSAAAVLVVLSIRKLLGSSHK
ncbi:PQQ-dependent sugar dehydrogenase [Arthrobacter sp. VKM Ac-2550]|uniref:PQQ-dependent sugar dehydrogenase n=1 Tax=Crystallibacter permensis TaxID=1938888 RepID=UPI0022262D62|nr:PQQ-dependent sugar dehydrogenase [Arthrobacter sp. VKM Ac-2550]MCW2135397.1 Glucose / Sorbosone dehydrogenase [Arthrobacter sp. VKM Ac-2550]